MNAHDLMLKEKDFILMSTPGQFSLLPSILGRGGQEEVRRLLSTNQHRVV